MKKFIIYFFGITIIIVSLALITNSINNSVRAEINKIKDEKSKDLVLKGFKKQTNSSDYS